MGWKSAAWLALVAWGAALGIGSVARAQGPRPDSDAPVHASAQQDEASAHFRRGVELYQEGAFRAALVELEKAYETLPNFRILFNVGQVKLDLQDYLGAIRAYEAYLAEGGANVPPQRRELVANQIAALRERVGTLVIRTDRAGVELVVDDVRVGASPLAEAVAVNVGSHRVVAHAEGGATVVRTVNVAGGERVEVALVVPLQAPANAPSRRAQPRAVSKRPRRLVLAAFGVAGALLAGAIASGVQTERAQTRLDNRLERAPVDPQAVQDTRDSVQFQAVLTDALGGAALGAAVAGTVGLVLWRQRSAKTSEGEGMSVTTQGTTLMVRARF